jgi:Spy/CpxP family protein refolding chaperone
MSRFRVTVIMAGLVVASAALALTSNAQQPPGGRGGRGGRGQGGPGGPGGPGMWGGPGGPGGNLLMLAGNEVVQKELKLTDKQKAQVKKISEESNNKRRDVFQNLRQQADAAKNEAVQEAQAQAAAGQQADPSLDARGSGAGNPLINSLNSRGFRPQIYGGQPLDDPAAAQQAQQAQQAEVQAQVNNVQAQGWQMMREAMDQLQHESERDLARALDKNQVKRLKEIQLQVEGPFAVLRPEITEKLELGEEQVAQIQEIQNESNQARRQAFAAGRDVFAGFRKSQQGNNNQPGTNQADPKAAADQAQDGNNAGGNGRGRNGRGGNGRGGNGPGGNGPGGNGPGGGPGGRGNFDPEAMRKYMEQPEVKAKMDQMKQQQDQIRDQSYAQVYRVLDRRQSSAFKKMLGKPFDVDSITNGFFRGPGQRGQGGGSAAAKTDTAKSDAAKPTDSEAKSAAKADPAATSKPASTPRRQSLRERRGLGQQQPQ